MKVLIVRVGALGDVLHALPAVAALRRARPDWTIDWVVDPRWSPLLVDGEESGPIVDSVQLAETRLWKASPVSLKTLRSIVRLRRQLRAGHYDLVVDMQGTLRSASIGWMARAKAFGGYSDPREPMAARLYRSTMKRRGTHVVEQGVALLSEATGVALEPEPVALPHEGWADAWAEELVGSDRVCVLSAGAGWGAKRWPARRFGALAERLHALGYRVFVNAPRADNALAAEVIHASAGAAEFAVCNVAGMIALLRRAGAVVGGDSGPVHLAAALGVPVVALFGPTDPARNGPWGSGLRSVLRDAASVTSYKRNDGLDHGLAKVTVKAVTAAVLAVTAPRANPSA